SFHNAPYVKFPLHRKFLPSLTYLGTTVEFHALRLVKSLKTRVTGRIPDVHEVRGTHYCANGAKVSRVFVGISNRAPRTPFTTLPQVAFLSLPTRSRLRYP